MKSALEPMAHVDPFWMTLYSLTFLASLGVQIAVIVAALGARERVDGWKRPLTAALAHVLLLVALPVATWFALAGWMEIFGATEGWALGATVRSAAPATLVHITTAVSGALWLPALRSARV